MSLDSLTSINTWPSYPNMITSGTKAKMVVAKMLNYRVWNRIEETSRWYNRDDIHRDSNQPGWALKLLWIQSNKLNTSLFILVKICINKVGRRTQEQKQVSDHICDGFTSITSPTESYSVKPPPQ